MLAFTRFDLREIFLKSTVDTLMIGAVNNAIRMKSASVVIYAPNRRRGDDVYITVARYDVLSYIQHYRDRLDGVSEESNSNHIKVWHRKIRELTKVKEHLIRKQNENIKPL